MRTWLVDTGPLVAYLDAADPMHDAVVAAWDQQSGRTATTSAVVTEAMHLVSADPAGPGQLVELINASATELFDLSQLPQLRAAAALMKQYVDTPMDFADATLVLLAEALGVDEILTLDRRGFAAFRTTDGRGLRNLLDEVQ